MDRIIVAVILATVAVAVATLVQRRRVDPPTQPASGFAAPRQLDRHDFARPDAPWLVCVFTSSTCATCDDVWTRVVPLASGPVAVQKIDAVADRDVHERYGIEAVPIVAIADADGVVRSSFVGPTTSTHLWAALADLREPGSVPSGCVGHGDDLPTGTGPDEPPTAVHS